MILTIKLELPDDPDVDQQIKEWIHTKDTDAREQAFRELLGLPKDRQLWVLLYELDRKSRSIT